MPVTLREGYIRLATGARMYYQRLGTGDPVVLLHGIAHSSKAWQRVIVPLAEHHDVIALDLLGCGRSDKPHTDYSLGSQAATVRYALEALGVDDLVTLVGHSLGGGVAMTFAYHYPDRVGRLALVSSGGLGRELHSIFRLATLPMAPPLVMDVLFAPVARIPRDALRRLAGRLGWDPFFHTKGRHDHEVDDLLRPLEDPDARRAFLGMLRSASDVSGQAVSALDRIGHSPFPVLIVWGRQDEVFPVEHAERTAALVTDVRLVVLDDCGHFPQIEATAAFNAAVRDWLLETRPQRADLSMMARLEDLDGRPAPPAAEPPAARSGAQPRPRHPRRSRTPATAAGRSQ